MTIETLVDQYLISENDIRALEWLVEGYKFLLERSEHRRQASLSKRFDDLLIDLKDHFEAKSPEMQKALQVLLEELQNVFHFSHRVHILMGYHGAILFDGCQSGYAEFDCPRLAADKLEYILDLTLETEIPSSFEFQLPSLKNLCDQFPALREKLDRALKAGLVEIVNTTYSHPYITLMSPESNLRQLQYGTRLANEEFGVEAKVYVCSEHALHPQFPQLLRQIGVERVSLRSRLCGTSPATPYPVHYWRGLDGSEALALAPQAGGFNGEYYASSFYKEMFSMIFQCWSMGATPYWVFNCLVDHTVEVKDRLEEAYRVSRFGPFLGRHMTLGRFFDEGPKPEGTFQHTYDQFTMIYIPHEQGQGLGRKLFQTIYELENNLLRYEAQVALDWLNGKEREVNWQALDEAWKTCLLAQNHDSVAIPYYRSGQYHLERSFLFNPQDLEGCNRDENYPCIGDYTMRLLEEQLQKFPPQFKDASCDKEGMGTRMSDRLTLLDQRTLELHIADKRIRMRLKARDQQWLLLQQIGAGRIQSADGLAVLEFSNWADQIHLQLFTEEDRVWLEFSGFEPGGELWVNYPLGMERSMRNRLQTLNTLWIKDRLLIVSPCNYYYECDRERSVLMNYLYERGSYEFLLDLKAHGDDVLPMSHLEQLCPSVITEVSPRWSDMAKSSEPGILLSALCPCPDASILMRLLNHSGRSQKVHIHLPEGWHVSSEVNLLGQVLSARSGESLNESFNPWTFKNFMLRKSGNPRR